MKLQSVILIGFIIWMFGCYCDISLIRYAYSLIIGGTIISVTGAVIWLRYKGNRSRLKRTFRVPKNVDEMTRQAFDFQWSRVSIMWTVCAFIAMIAVHVESFIMKSTEAYDCAVAAIAQNQKIHDIIGETVRYSYIVTRHENAEGISEIRFGVIGSKDKVKLVAFVDRHDGVYVTHKILIDE
jgi:hypothetical protein